MVGENDTYLRHQYQRLIKWRKPNVKKLLIGIIVFLCIILLGTSYIVIDLIRYAEKPADAQAEEKIMVVMSGQDLGALSGHLASERIISHPAKFKLFARIKGYDKKIKAGEYTLSASMSPAKILQTIVNGKVRLYRITIPEGYNLKQISKVIEESGLGSESEFLKMTSDSVLLKQKGIEGKTFEGYLFPDTYYFPKGIRIEEIISTMVSRFWSVYTSQWQQRTSDLGLSVHEVVTLASIIEKETGDPSERPVISSVFHNRMKKRMRLESDPTVIYGIEGFDGNITRTHLSTPTPYNTYTQRGLPPGPIANPGKASIEAALYPADSSYIYFVAKGDGTHQFSTNIKEHRQAVRKYQLRR